VLINLGVHDLDLAAYLGGGDVTLRGAAGALSSETPGRTLAHVLMTTGCGAVANVYVDRTVPDKRRSITLTTTRWIYEGDLLSHRLVRRARDGGARSEVRYRFDEPLVAQAIALADALDGAAPRELATRGGRREGRGAPRSARRSGARRARRWRRSSCRLARRRPE